eukprot:gene2503-3250_t
MAGTAAKLGDWAISMAKHGDSWWLSLVLLVVSITNSLTAGTLMWCLGVMQAVLYSTIVLARRGPSGVLIGPLMLTIGASISAYTYMELLKQGGADYILETTGTAQSKYLETARSYASQYGAWGLFGLQVAPIPIPTAILVATGVMAGIDDWLVFSVVIGSKFVQLIIGAAVLQFVAKGMTVEQYLQ